MTASPDTGTTIIGVLSDTHLPHRLPALPAWVPEAFRVAGVSLILHAGDVDEPRMLDALSAVAPVVAVRGNVHLTSRSRSSPHLPVAAEIEVHGKRIVVTHGHGRPHQWLWDKRRGYIGFRSAPPGVRKRDAFNEVLVARNARRFPYADVLIFGHSHHRLLRQVGRTLFLNSGAIAHAKDETPSVAILTVSAGGSMNVEFIEGERNRKTQGPSGL